MSGASSTHVVSAVVSLPGKRTAKSRGCLPDACGVGRKPAKKA
jgi:hypothetical protein